MNPRFVLPIALTSALLGCGNQPSSVSADSKSTALNGKWQGHCDTFKDEGDGSLTSERVDLEFTADKAQAFVRAFQGKDCPSSSPWYTKSAASSYKLTGDSPLGDGIKNIDMVLEKFSMTPHTDNEAKSLNAEKTCGITDWKANVEVDLTDKKCSDDDTRLHKGDKAFDIYQIRGNIVRFGLNATKNDPDSDVGRSEDKRPKALTEYDYTKG